MSIAWQHFMLVGVDIHHLILPLFDFRKHSNVIRHCCPLKGNTDDQRRRPNRPRRKDRQGAGAGRNSRIRRARFQDTMVFKRRGYSFVVCASVHVDILPLVCDPEGLFGGSPIYVYFFKLSPCSLGHLCLVSDGGNKLS